VKSLNPDRQRKFRAAIVRAELADQPRRLAQRKRSAPPRNPARRRQRRVAGNRRAVLHCKQQRLVPQAIGEQPKLLAPDAELLPEQIVGSFAT